MGGGKRVGSTSIATQSPCIAISKGWVYKEGYDANRARAGFEPLFFL